MILQVHTPTLPLHKFVDHFIYHEGFNPIHRMDRFLPDGNTELIIELTDNAKYIYDNGGYITVYFTLIGFILGVWR